jgi:ribosomal protein S18 acetylase RimI-like enzyme
MIKMIKMIKITKGFKKSDFDALLRINDLCYSGDERPDKETFARMLNFSEVWIARTVFDKPVGFIIVNETMDVPYLWSMAVLPEARSQGTGQRMLSLICTEYKDRAVELHCRVDNPVQKMYFDNGFRVVDIARGYYKIDGKQIDGLKMRRG